MLTSFGSRFWRSGAPPIYLFTNEWCALCSNEWTTNCQYENQKCSDTKILMGLGGLSWCSTSQVLHLHTRQSLSQSSVSSPTETLHAEWFLFFKTCLYVICASTKNMDLLDGLNWKAGAWTMHTTVSGSTFHFTPSNQSHPGSLSWKT